MTRTRRWLPPLPYSQTLFCAEPTPALDGWCALPPGHEGPHFVAPDGADPEEAMAAAVRFMAQHHPEPEPLDPRVELTLRGGRRDLLDPVAGWGPR